MLPDPGSIELVQTSGGWRIDRLPNGVFLDWQQFQATYKRNTLYFADPTGKTKPVTLRSFKTPMGIRITAARFREQRRTSPLLAVLRRRRRNTSRAAMCGMRSGTNRIL